MLLLELFRRKLKMKWKFFSDSLAIRKLLDIALEVSRSHSLKIQFSKLSWKFSRIWCVSGIGGWIKNRKCDKSFCISRKCTCANLIVYKKNLIYHFRCDFNSLDFFHLYLHFHLELFCFSLNNNNFHIESLCTKKFFFITRTRNDQQKK